MSPFNCQVVFSDHALQSQMWRIISADMGEDALQFVERAVADDQLALALGAVFYLDWRAQTLCQALFETTDIRIRLALDWCRFGRQPLANQGFGLAHGETACDNMSRALDLLFEG